jgi:hypothetical protein
MVEDFEKHLKNRHHRERVQERVQERKKGAGR